MKPSIAANLKQSVRLSYDTFASEWNTTRQMPWHEFELLVPHLKPKQSILDLGCGNGRLASFLSGSDISYLGLDNSAELLKLAEKTHPHARFLLGDLTSLPLPDASIDFVISIAALHHLPGAANRAQAFSEISRVLKPGGFCFLTVWNLFQPRYIKYLRQNKLNKLLFRSNLDWNDAYVPFGQDKVLRYVHAFTPHEVKHLAKPYFSLLSETYTRKEETLKSWKSAYNLCYLFQKQA